MFTMERLRGTKWVVLGHVAESPVARLSRVVNPKGWGVTNLVTGERWECSHNWQGLVPVATSTEKRR